MEKKLYIFDLDDTLVRYGKKISIPRQTFHVLRNLQCQGHQIVIVSYNPLCPLVVTHTKLRKYVKHEVYGSLDRHVLVEKALAKMGYSKTDKFFYVDDRLDNIHAIKELFANVETIHVKDPLTLYKFVPQ